MFVIIAFGRQGQGADCRFVVSLVYRVRPCLNDNSKRKFLITITSKCGCKSRHRVAQSFNMFVAIEW